MGVEDQIEKRRMKKETEEEALTKRERKRADKHCKNKRKGQNAIASKRPEKEEGKGKSLALTGKVICRDCHVSVPLNHPPHLSHAVKERLARLEGNGVKTKPARFL